MFLIMHTCRCNRIVCISSKKDSTSKDNGLRKEYWDQLHTKHRVFRSQDPYVVASAHAPNANNTQPKIVR